MDWEHAGSLSTIPDITCSLNDARCTEPEIALNITKYYTKINQKHRQITKQKIKKKKTKDNKEFTLLSVALQAPV